MIKPWGEEGAVLVKAYGNTFKDICDQLKHVSAVSYNIYVCGKFKQMPKWSVGVQP